MTFSHPSHHGRTIAWIAAMLALLGCSARDCGSSGEAPQKPEDSRASLLLFTLDTTRRDRLGIYGSDRGLTPNLDALGASGVAFMDARTEVPITLPSHATMLTGLGIREHGVRENGAFVVRDDVTTLAEVLRSEGYRTAAFVSSFVLDEQFGLAQGFDHYDDEMTSVRRRRWHGRNVPRFERQGHDTAARAIAWLRETEGEDAPFFVWVHFYDPHSPYRPPPEHEKEGRSAYDGEIAFMDEQLGAVLRAARDQTDDLLVAAASDHGEALGEHGLHGHGSDIYEPAMRAVLLLHHPTRAAAGARVEERVRLTDLAATSLDLLEVDRPFAGQSLRPRWSGADQEAPPVDELYMETILPALRGKKSGVHGILTGRHKLILWPQDERRVLYDLERDPNEKSDVQGEHVEIADRLEERLRELMASFDEGGKSDRVEMDDDTVSKLKALGYIE